MSGFPTLVLPRARTENCPPGFKTGDQIPPPGGYVGGGLQLQTDLAIGPAGDVWVINNWQDIETCFGVPPESISTRCGGQGVVGTAAEQHVTLVDPVDGAISRHRAADDAGQSR